MSAADVPLDHPVRQILQESIMPYIVSAKKLRWQPFYMAHSINTYSRDILVGLIGVGLSTPVMGVIAKALGPSPTAANTTSQNTSGLLEQIPPGWKGFVIVALIISVCLRVYVTQSKADERTILAKTCSDDIRQATINLTTLLNKNSPEDDLKDMNNQINRVINKGWPWDYDTAPGIKQEVTKRVNDLCGRFGNKWIGPPTGQQAAPTQAQPMPPQASI